LDPVFQPVPLTSAPLKSRKICLVAPGRLCALAGFDHLVLDARHDDDGGLLRVGREVVNLRIAGEGGSRRGREKGR